MWFSDELNARQQNAEDHFIYEQTGLFPPTDDGTDISPRMHNTRIHPLPQENRPSGGLRIHSNRILHQQEGK